MQKLRPTYRHEHELNENIVLIELDIEPTMFSEQIKERFLTKFQLMLDQHRKQFALIKPRVVLVNTRIIGPVGYSKSSSVVLELIVTDVLNENVVDWALQGATMNGLVVNDHVDLVGENRRVVDNSHLIRLMRRYQKAFRFSFENINIDTVWSYFGKETSHSRHTSPPPPAQSILDLLEIKVLSVSKLTCTSDFYASERPDANSYNCSNHGKCDFYSHRCICNKYWMPNLYLKYIDYESDLTNGNNCGNITFLIKFCFKN